MQRVPVKILVNGPVPADKQLRLGLSVNIAIDISDTSGPLLSSTLQQRREKAAVNRWPCRPPTVQTCNTNRPAFPQLRAWDPPGPNRCCFLLICAHQAQGREGREGG